MIRFKYILSAFLLLGIFISIENRRMTLKSYPIMACDDDDYDDDFDYDDTDYFDYWAEDSNAGNAAEYWDAFDSFVCTGSALTEEEEEYNPFGEMNNDNPWWEEEDPYDNGGYSTIEDITDDDPKDCAGVSGGNAYIDKCGECVGGETGKTACKDCSDVENGLSYYIKCGNDSVCVNGNVGRFDSQLNQHQQQIFEDVLSELRSNCWTNALLDNINKNSGLKISMDSHPNYPGVFNPCNHEISLDSSASISAYALTAELFHAYQDQIWEGKLRDISLDNEHNHIGGSNMEAEEKVMGKISYIWNGLHYATAYPKLDQWIDQYMISHITSHTCELSEEDLTLWYAAVQEFSEINQNVNTEIGVQNMYASPVDYSLPPQCLINICKSISQNCNPVVL